jgi:hypothetical protein
MPSFNDLLVAGLSLLFLVAVLRFCGVRRIPGIVFLVLLFFLVVTGSLGWAYIELRRSGQSPAYRAEWKNGTLEDLNGTPLDPESFKGPYGE